MRALIGQLVRLKGGGPALTITSENTHDDGSFSYFCQWFEYETLRSATFPIVALEPVEGSFITAEEKDDETPVPVNDKEFDDESGSEKV